MLPFLFNKQCEMTMKTINWNQASELGLVERINREVLHPLGLAMTRTPATGFSHSILVAPDKEFTYAPNIERKPIISTSALHDMINKMPTVTVEVSEQPKVESDLQKGAVGPLAGPLEDTNCESLNAELQKLKAEKADLVEANKALKERINKGLDALDCENFEDIPYNVSCALNGSDC